MSAEPEQGSRNGQAVEKINDLRALMADLRQNVDELVAILTTPEVPDGDPATA